MWPTNVQNSLTVKSWSNIAATPAAFTLPGGLYGVTVKGANYGTVTLKRLAPDNTTYITALTAFSADGYQSVYLPSGTYELVIASTTAVYADVVRSRKHHNFSGLVRSRSGSAELTFLAILNGSV